MIAFWKKETGNLMSASKGLTEEEIKFLQSLKIGDRLIVYNNNIKEGDNRPNFTIKKYEKKDK